MSDTARLSKRALAQNVKENATANGAQETSLQVAGTGPKAAANESDRPKARAKNTVQAFASTITRRSISNTDFPGPVSYTGQRLPAQGSDPGLALRDDDQTLYEKSYPYKNNKITIDDWSETGRGSNVAFEKQETISLKQGRWLGRGVTGDVYETTVKGWQVAHKRLVMNRTTLDGVQREVDILKRLSMHVHVVQLIGTYTHRQFLGMLLYPVAICDVSPAPPPRTLALEQSSLWAHRTRGIFSAFQMLCHDNFQLHTFFEDVEAWTTAVSDTGNTETQVEALDPDRKARLVALGYSFPRAGSHIFATPIYSRLGCLISAIAYLHEEKNKIRHKDLKPSNILLSADNLWLSDFGSATDFSLLSQSATDNGGGTLRYLSPEVATYDPAGRASDIFSLGCVLLEVIILHDRGTLEHIRQNRSPNPSFHSNLDRVDTWCKMVEDDMRSAMFHILRETRLMLSKTPALRPTAYEVLTRVTGYDLADTRPNKQSVFGHCCATSLVSEQHRKEETVSANMKLQLLRQELRTSEALKDHLQRRFDELQSELGNTRRYYYASLELHDEYCLSARQKEEELESTLWRERMEWEKHIEQSETKKKEHKRRLESLSREKELQHKELEKVRQELESLRHSKGRKSAPTPGIHQARSVASRSSGDLVASSGDSVPTGAELMSKSPRLPIFDPQNNKNGPVAEEYRAPLPRQAPDRNQPSPDAATIRPPSILIPDFHFNPKSFPGIMDNERVLTARGRASETLEEQGTGDQSKHDSWSPERSTDIEQNVPSTKQDLEDKHKPEGSRLPKATGEKRFRRSFPPIRANHWGMQNLNGPSYDAITAARSKGSSKVRRTLSGDVDATARPGDQPSLDGTAEETETQRLQDEKRKIVLSSLHLPLEEPGQSPKPSPATSYRVRDFFSRRATSRK